MPSLRNFFISLCVAAVIVVPVAYFVTNLIVTSLDSVTNNYGGGDEPGVTTDDPSSTGDTSDTEIKGVSFNILLIGTDYQPAVFSDYSSSYISNYPTFNSKTEMPDNAGYDYFFYRKIEADSMLIVSVNKEISQYSFCALPTDMRLEVGGGYMTLSEIYSEKGIEYLIKKIYSITGLSMDYYAVANIDSVATIIDILDGVTFTVPCNMIYSDPSQNLFINLRAGSQKLTGKNAVNMLRYNNYSGTSSTRESTSVAFAKAVISKVTNVAYYSKFPSIFESVIKYVYTDFTASDLSANIDLIFQYSRYTSVSYTYPGTVVTTDDGTYFEPDLTAAVNMLSAIRN